MKDVGALWDTARDRVDALRDADWKPWAARTLRADLRHARVVLPIAVPVVCAVGVLGTFLHQVPYLGLATLVVPALTPWFLVLAVLGVVWWGLRWWRARHWAPIGLGTLSVLVAVGSAVIVGQLAGAATRAGTEVNLARTFGFAEPVVPVPELDTDYFTDLSLPVTPPPPPPPVPPGTPPPPPPFGQPFGLTVFPASRTATAGAPAPVLVYLHGGGWSGGTRYDRRGDLRWFADRGWMGIGVDFATSTPTIHPWDKTEGQIACALVWVQQHARALGGDPERVSITGDYSGGTLALNVAYRAAQRALPSSCGGTVPPLKTVVAVGPVLDPVGLYASTDPLFGPAVRRMLTLYVDGTPEQVPDRYRSLGPATHLGPGVPPTLVISGETDHIVPPGAAPGFVEQVRRAGADAELIQLPYADQGFDQFPGGIGQQLYRQVVLDWLGKHGR